MHKFVKKTSIPNPVKNLGYIKCQSSSSPVTIEISSNFIRYNCQLYQKDLKLYWKTEKRLLEVTFPEAINKPIIHKFFKDFNNLLQKQDSYRHILKFQLVCVKGQVHNSSETPLA